MPKRKALITGVAGQDGSYLSELLLEKGYEVHGVDKLVPGLDTERPWARISHILDLIELHELSIENLSNISALIHKIQPDECYHLAAQSFVSYDAVKEFQTIRTNMDGTHHLLAAVRERVPNCHFFFASSSEMFGRTEEYPQNERTAFYPRSIYGISKTAGFYLTRYYRENYRVHASSGILYNHESPRRGHQFVTRKITRQAAAIKMGFEKEIRLGNLDARRDWGHAKDYVRAMWMMMQQPDPDDYIISTGVTHTVEEFAERAFRHLGLDFKDHVVVDEDLVRSNENNILVGDASKARNVLGWEPEISFDEMIREMVLEDMKTKTGSGDQGAS